LGIVALNHPAYVEKGWHIFLIMVCFSLFNLVVHTYGRRILPALQAASGVAHILFFIIIVVVILALTPKAPSSFVWTEFKNTGGWSSNGISFCIGLLLPAFSISGADGCVHMAEEVRNASWNIPRVFVYTLLINGTMAFGIVVVCLYAITDLDQVLDTRTGFPIIQILYNATGSYAGTTILDLMMVAIQITCSLCLCAASSRLAWSFSRENGFPGANFMKKVHPKFMVPFNAIVVTITFAVCLSTIVIGSTVAIDAVVSLCTVAAFASYTLPIASFLWYRLTHTGIRYGPWRMGRYGPYVNAFALCWCVFFVIILPFPSILPVTAQNMNWSGPIFLAITILLSCDWVLRARHVYRGPVIEIDGVTAEDTAPAQEVQTTFIGKN
jgi:choline transport protein